MNELREVDIILLRYRTLFFCTPRSPLITTVVVVTRFRVLVVTVLFIINSFTAVAGWRARLTIAVYAVDAQPAAALLVPKIYDLWQSDVTATF